MSKNKKVPQKAAIKKVVPSIDEMVKKSPPKKAREKVVNKIGEILVKKNMTQSELCYLAEMYPAHLSEIIIHSRKGVSIAIALKIAKALETPVEEIFFIEIKE